MNCYPIDQPCPAELRTYRARKSLAGWKFISSTATSLATEPHTTTTQVLGRLAHLRKRITHDKIVPTSKQTNTLRPTDFRYTASRNISSHLSGNADSDSCSCQENNCSIKTTKGRRQYIRRLPNVKEYLQQNNYTCIPQINVHYPEGEKHARCMPPTPSTPD